MLFKIIILIIWFLLLYAFSHEEKVREFGISIKDKLNQLYWGDELIKCRDLQERIIFNRDLSTVKSKAYSSMITDLLVLKNEFGEDISVPLGEVRLLLEKEIKTRSKLRQVFGESLIQMVILGSIINLMSFAYAIFLEIKNDILLIFWLNFYMIMGGTTFRALFNYLLNSKVNCFLKVQTSLNQFLVLAGTSVSMNEINKRVGYDHFRESWGHFDAEKELLLEALKHWNNSGIDPSVSLSHISRQIGFKFKISMESFQKINEAVKLLVLIIFFLIPYFFLSFSKLMEGLESLS